MTVFNFGQFEIDVIDTPGSWTMNEVFGGLKYNINGIDNIPFEINDFVVDIGANVGMVSLYIAKKYPSVIIYSYEPVPQIYECLLRNIEVNQITNIFPFNLAITSDGRELPMDIALNKNSGGSSGFVTRGVINGTSTEKIIVKSISIADVFKNHNISGTNKCRFMKMDCEGAEHEIIRAMTDEMKNSIEYMTCEIHFNENIRKDGPIDQETTEILQHQYGNKLKCWNNNLDAD